MTQKLRYFCTLLLVAVASVAWADEETIDFTAQGYENAQAVTETTGTVVKATFTNGGTPTAYYTTGEAVRVYNGGTMSITANGNTITKIEYTYVLNGAATATVAGKNSEGTYDSGTKTWTGSDTEVVLTAGTAKHVRISQVVVTYTAGDTDAPSITTENVNIEYDATGGQIAYTIENEVEGGSVNASTDADWISFGPSFNSPIAFSCEANEGGERTATVTLTYSYGDSESVTKNVTVTQAGNPNAPGTENNPYTVAEALANTPASGTSANVYVRGIVSRFQKEGGIMEDGNNFRYYISDDGTTTSEIQVYRGKGLNNVAFSNNNDLLVGDEVVIYGGLTTYNTTKEIAANNYIVSLNRPTPTDPTVTVNPTAVEVDAAEHDGTITVSCENMGENLNISVFFCEETDVTTPAEYDWITADIDNQNNVYYIIEANTATEARTAYMVVKVADADAKEVYTSKLITFTQAGKELPSVTWDLSKDETATATTTEMSWTSDYATMLVEKAGSSTNTNNYYPGSATPRTSTRFYNGSELTISPNVGYKITKIEFTATTTGYASALNNSTWTNATAAVDGTNVTVTPTNGNLAMVATIGENCGFTGVKVYYEESDVMVIKIKKDFTATTFSCDKALDFSAVEGITANIITDENGLTKPVEKVPAGKGLYIVGAEGNYEVPFLADETKAEDVSANWLIPTDGTTEFKSESVTYYAFGKQNGKEAFYKVPASGYTPSANKAVLVVNAPASSAKEMIVIGGDVTGIESIENGTIVNDNYYTIDGKLVKGQPTQKGIYVVNGRKVVIK